MGGSSKSVQKRARLRERVFRREHGKCFWCRRDVVLPASEWPIPFNVASLDHIIPRSKGGSNAAINLVLSCMPCNGDRGDRPAEEYLIEVHRRSAA